MSDVDLYLYYKYYSGRQVTMHFFAHLQTDNLLRLLILDNNRVFTVVNKELVGFIELTNQSSDFNIFHHLCQARSNILPQNFLNRWLFLIRAYWNPKSRQSAFPAEAAVTCIKFIMWFCEFSVTTNLQIFRDTEFVYLFLCNVCVNK